MAGRTIIAGTVALLAIIAAAAIYLLVAGPDGARTPGTIAIEGSDLGGPFELTATDGSRVTDADIVTGPTLIYFGYTSCPDICPIDTLNMADAVDLLAAKGIAARAVFVTVDPERDTPGHLDDYVSAIHPEMIALTGSTEELKATITRYGGFFDRVEMGDSAMGYLMRHTGFIYLLLPGEGLAAVFEQGVPPENIAAEVERLAG